MNRDDLRKHLARSVATMPDSPDVVGPVAGLYPACKGTNCGATDGVNHSAECQAEHAAAVAGGYFVKAQPAAPGGVDTDLLNELVQVASEYGNSELLRASLAEVLVQRARSVKPIGYVLMSDKGYTFRLNAEFAAFGAIPNGQHDVYTTPPPQPDSGRDAALSIKDILDLAPKHVQSVAGNFWQFESAGLVDFVRAAMAAQQGKKGGDHA